MANDNLKLVRMLNNKLNILQNSSQEEVVVVAGAAEVAEAVAEEASEVVDAVVPAVCSKWKQKPDAFD